MGTRQKAGLLLYLTVIVFLTIRCLQLTLGVEYLPYQQQVVGLPWAEVPANYKNLINFLNGLIGGALLVVCFAVLILLAIPYRRGDRWAVFAIPAILLAYCTVSLTSSFILVQRSESNPSIMAVSIFAALTLIAFAITVTDKPQRKAV